MLIEKKFQLDRAVDDAGGRPVIEEVFLDKENPNHPRLVATNGKIMAVVPVHHAEDDAQGLIKAEAFRVGRSKTQKKLPGFTMKADGEVRVDTKDGAQVFPRTSSEDMKFPRWRSIFNGIVNPKVKHVKVKIDAELLHRLADAIGSDRVELTIPEDGEHCIMVRSLSRDAYGAIMPVFK
jgi:hypothetical protein